MCSGVAVGEAGIGARRVVRSAACADQRRTILPPWPMCRKTSPKACRRSRSPASARFRTCRRRTTGTAATWPSTSGSPRALRGLRVADLACGEGYGSATLARTAAQVVGVDANPEAHEHARLRYTQPNLRFERGLVEDYSEPCDAVVFLQTIEHIHDPGALLARDRQGGAARLRLDPEPPDARAGRRREVREPMAPARVHGGRVPRALRAALRRGAAHRRLPCAKAPAHEVALGLGWDRVHKATRPDEALLRPLHAGDRRLGLRPSRRGGVRPRQGARLPGRASSMNARASGGVRGHARDRPSLAHALRRGFGTYPFGEEWLFDAVLRSYLPVLEVADRLTMTVTPVLADQLEAPGLGERLRGLRRGVRLGSTPARRRASRTASSARPASERQIATAAGSPACDELGGPLGAFQEAAARRAGFPHDLERDPRRAAPPGDRLGARPPARCSPSLASPALRRARRHLAAGVRVRARPRGSGRAPRIQPLLRRSVRARRAARRTAPDRDRRRPRRLPDRLGGRLVALVARRVSVGSAPHGLSPRVAARRSRVVDRQAGSATPRPERSARASRPASSSPQSPRAWRGHRERTGSEGLVRVRDRHRAPRPLVVGGPGLARRGHRVGRVARRRARHARRRTRAQSSPRTVARSHRSSWGEHKDLSTWDSPEVSDMAWGARRLELRLVRELAAAQSGA